MSRRPACALACLLLAAAAAWAAGRSDPPEILEARLSEALESALGPGRVKVSVRARKGTPGTTSSSSAGMAAGGAPSRERSAALWDSIVRRAQSAPPVLPGYRVPSALRDEALQSLKDELRLAVEPPARPATAEPALSVSLVLDARSGPAEVEAVRRTAAAALGLDPARGDGIKISFAPRPAAATGGPAAKPAPGRSAARSIVLYSGPPAFLMALAALSLGLRKRNIPAPAAPAPAVAKAPAPRRPAARWLSLNRPGQIAAAVRALMTEPVEACVRALRSMDPESAAQVYRRLPWGQRLSAARVLLRRRAGGPGRDAVERLAAQVDAFETGEGLLSSLLLRLPEPERERLLSELSAEFPAETLRLRREAPKIEELADADAASLRTCLSVFSCDELALCLYELPDDQRSRILAALPEAIRTMVEERARVLVPESSELVDSARAQVVSRWRRLELCGRVRSLHGSAA